MRFDFTDLNLFRHIVEAGSITHGAARANLALAAASTRIRKMELAFGTELLVRGRQGVMPTPAGRTLLQHARGILAQTERLQEDLTPLCARARRPGAGAVQYQCAHRVPAGDAELVPDGLSRYQRRPRGAPVRRDRRPDGGRRRRYRHRRRHRRLRRPAYVSVPQRPLRAGGRAQTTRSPAARASVLPRCSITTWSASTAPARSSASSPTRPTASAGRCGCACSCAASTPSAAWSNANVGVGIVPETTVKRTERNMAISSVRLTDPWALRELSICVRDIDTLPPYARQLVDHLRASA